MPCRGEWLS